MSKNHEAEVQLRQERLSFSEVEQFLKALIDTKESARPETTLAYRGVQKASMWLGKALGALGVRYPYPASTDPSSKVIEARADFKIGDFQSIEWLKDVTDEISAIKAVRARLKELEKAIKNDMTIMQHNREYQLCVANAWTRCCEATMDLGLVLNAIKLEDENRPEQLLEPLTGSPTPPYASATTTEGHENVTVTLAPSNQLPDEQINFVPPTEKDFEGKKGDVSMDEVGTTTQVPSKDESKPDTVDPVVTETKTTQTEKPSTKRKTKEEKDGKSKAS
jgi:hypothetical protein